MNASPLIVAVADTWLSAIGETAALIVARTARQMHAAPNLVVHLALRRT